VQIAEFRYDVESGNSITKPGAHGHRDVQRLSGIWLEYGGGRMKVEIELNAPAVESIQMTESRAGLHERPYPAMAEVVSGSNGNRNALAAVLETYPKSTPSPLIGVMPSLASRWNRS
jgi:hypothetical protein